MAFGAVVPLLAAGGANGDLGVQDMFTALAMSILIKQKKSDHKLWS